MAGIRNKKRGSAYQGWYFDHTGKRCWFEGTASKTETRQIARELETHHRQIRLGRLPPPGATRPDHSLADTMAEYLAWGTSQGGRGGRPWGAAHARHRTHHLGWWRDTLSLSTVHALEGCLPIVESALRSLQRAGKTRSNYAESLRAFCLWCVERGYLDLNPLKNLRAFDRTPQTQRRALTADEIERLLQAAPSHRRLLYQTALATGLRATELRHLTLRHLDLERRGVHLHAAWTKNRKNGFQPIPAWLADRLHAAASSGEAEELYARHYGPHNRPVPHPSLPLVYVPRDPSRAFLKDCLASDILLETEAGRVVFHSLRITFINRVIAAGATLKEAQALARHASPEMTFNVYGRADETRMLDTIETASAELDLSAACVTCVSTETVQAANDVGFRPDPRDETHTPAPKAGGFKSPLRHPPCTRIRHCRVPSRRPLALRPTLSTLPTLLLMDCHERSCRCHAANFRS